MDPDYLEYLKECEFSEDDALSQEGVQSLPRELEQKEDDFDRKLFIDASIKPDPDSLSISKRDSSLCIIVRILDNYNSHAINPLEKEIATEILEAIAKKYPDSCIGASKFEERLTPNMHGHSAVNIPTLEELVINAKIHGFINQDFIQGFVCEYARELERANEHKRALEFYEIAININEKNIRACIAKCGYHRTAQKLKKPDKSTELDAERYFSQVIYSLKDSIGNFPDKLNNVINLTLLEGLVIYFKKENLKIHSDNYFSSKKISPRSKNSENLIKQLSQANLNHEQRVTLLKLKAEYQLFLYKKIYFNKENPQMSESLRERRLDKINKKAHGAQSYDGRKIWSDLKIRLLELYVNKYDIRKTAQNEFFIPKVALQEGYLLSNKILGTNIVFTTKSAFAENLLININKLLNNYSEKFISSDSSLSEVNNLKKRKSALRERLSLKFESNIEANEDLSRTEISISKISILHGSSFPTTIDSLIKNELIGNFSIIPEFSRFIISNLEKIELFNSFKITSCIPIKFKYSQSTKNNGYLVEILNDHKPEHWCYFGTDNITNPKVCYSPEPVACILMDKNSEFDSKPSSLTALEPIFSEQAFKLLATSYPSQLIQSDLLDNTELEFSELFYVENKLVKASKGIGVRTLISRLNNGSLIVHRDY